MNVTIEPAIIELTCMSRKNYDYAKSLLFFIALCSRCTLPRVRADQSRGPTRGVFGLSHKNEWLIPPQRRLAGCVMVSRSLSKAVIHALHAHKRLLTLMTTLKSTDTVLVLRVQRLYRGCLYALALTILQHDDDADIRGGRGRSGTGTTKDLGLVRDSLCSG